ncbi:MAG: hypothetical protein RQ754_02845 [Desulfuromonadales bacterium]|nr:hypothetical protein [Desulfuromonadales bacterium]
MKIARGPAIITCVAAPVVAAWAAVASAAVGGYAAYQSGQTQKQAAKYNEKMGEYRALDAAQRGASEAAAKRDRARKIASQQASGMAAAGVDINSGTPLALLTETAGLGELDALTVTNNARREAWGYRAQGTLDRYQGKMAGRAGVLNAGGTFLGGASNAYFGYKAAS